MAQISVRTFTDKDLPDFLALSQSEYGTSTATTDESHIRWKHLASPFGASAYICLNEADRVVGRVLVQPRPLCTATKELAAASVMDLLIDREHRTTPGNFIQLTRATRDATGFQLIYHTSNEKTFPLYSKLLRFSNPFSLSAYGFPLRIAGILASHIGCKVGWLDRLTAPWRGLLTLLSVIVGKLARLDVAPTPIGDDELATLSLKCLQRAGPHLARTNTFLKWRFTDAPQWPATVHRVTHKGKFMGYVATRRVELNGMVHWVLMDMLLDVDMPLITRIALRLWLIRQAAAAGADALFTMVNYGSAVARTAVGFPFIPIPERLLPHATPIFIRECSAEGKTQETDGTFHLTLSDLDYF
jgi:hypothetical protein